MDNFLKSFFNNSPVYFAEAPSVPKDVQEAAAGGSTTENQNKPDQQQENVDQKPTLEGIGAEKNAQTRERAKNAWTKVKEVSGKTADVARGLASKEGGKLVLEKMDAAKDKLVDKKDSIADKAAAKRDEVIDKANVKANELVDNAKDKLITQPKEKVKDFGRGVKEYFGDKGRNIADMMRANKAEWNAYGQQRLADKYQAKLDRANDKLARAEQSGRAPRIDMLNRKSERMRERADAYRGFAQKSREGATRIRARAQTRADFAKAA